MALRCLRWALCVVAWLLSCAGVDFALSRPILKFQRSNLPCSCRHATEANMDSRVSAGFVMGTFKGSTVGAAQYLWLVWKHINECPQTLKADAAAHQLLPWTSDHSISGRCLWLLSSSWTYFFADISHKHILVRLALQTTVGLFCVMFTSQVLWSFFSQKQGRISEHTIGFRAWKAVITFILAALGSQWLCQYTLLRFCVLSSWTGLPYYTEGHLICAAASVFGGLLGCTSSSVAFAHWHRHMHRKLQGAEQPSKSNDQSII